VRGVQVPWHISEVLLAQMRQVLHSHQRHGLAIQALHFAALQCNAMQCNTIQYNTINAALSAIT
jgi:hypothetical protein